jgi:hypothetical protein
MNEKANHPRSEMVVGFLLVDEMYLQATMVANLSALEVTILQEVVVVVFQEVAVKDIHKMKIQEYTL